MSSMLAADPVCREAGYVLGIDIGTASSKATLCQLDGTVAAKAIQHHATSMPRPGWVEHDAHSVWWHDATELIRAVLPSPRELIQAVCISGIGPCVQAADSSGRPLRPAILYGIDTRAAGLGERLQEELGGTSAVLDRCGCAITSQSAGPKLAWIREHEPEVWSRTRRFFMAHNYIAHRLTDVYVLDHHAASQCTPLYDRRKHEWIPEWAAEIAPGISLPELRWPSDVAGHVTRSAAAATGLAEGTAVAVGTIDAWAEAESVDVRRPGDLMVMYGSTMFFVAVTAEPLLASTLWSTSGNYPDQHTLAAGMASAGAITAWYRDLTSAPSFDQLIAEAEAAGPGAHGLLALPYFAGERTPIADPLAGGVLAGLTLRHTRGDIYRALLESTAYGVRHNLSAFATAGFKPQRIVAVGGGTTSELWPRIVSDVIAARQQIPRTRTGASFGDAKFAAVALGAVPPTGQWNAAEAIIRPDPGHAALHDHHYQLYSQLRAATSNIQHELARER